MKEVLREIYYFILKHLPSKFVINVENFMSYKKFVDKKNPKFFGEKIQWLKLYGNLEKYNNYVDKYLVREFIKKEIGEDFLIPLLGVYDKAENIDYENLPEQFVLKINNGSAMNIIVKDKSKINIKKINKKLNKWLKNDYSKIKKEFQYKNVERKIICEKYIVDKNQQLLDYKFFCFNGKPHFFKVDFDRFENHTANFYDLNWNLLDMKEKCVGGVYKNYLKKIEPIDNFNEMVKIVKKLCKKFQFVRVDLYNVDGKIYFGELTFTPASGRHPFIPIEKDIEIAKEIKIENE